MAFLPLDVSCSVLQTSSHMLFLGATLNQTLSLTIPNPANTTAQICRLILCLTQPRLSLPGA